jgi:hypothetical protein
MGLDLWFRDDVVRILASTQRTMRSSIAASRPLDVAVADSYRAGFDDALRSVAVAFGICKPASLVTRYRGPASALYVQADHMRPADQPSGRTRSEQEEGRGSHDSIGWA